MEAKDAEVAKSGLAKLHELIIGQQVRYADVLKLKVGKPDVWNPDKTLFLESGGTRWLNIMARGGLYFFGATVASGQPQQPCAYPINHGW